MNKNPIPVTIAVINYNGEKVLKETFESIYRLDYPSVSEIFLVDNNSTDKSVNLIKENFSGVKILQTGKNLGACFARNIAIKNAKSNLIFLIDNDVILSADVLTKLMDIYVTNQGAGVLSAQVRFYDNPEKIQYNGANIHFAGGAIQNKDKTSNFVVVGAVPGTAIVVDKLKAMEIGLFDEDFFYGWEDGDFSFRLTLAGYLAVVVPSAIVYHKKVKRGLHWVDYQVRNRWWFILKTYNLRTLFFSMPAILIYQATIMAFLLIKGEFFNFCKGSFDVIKSLPMIMKKRKFVMIYKKVKDGSNGIGKKYQIG